MFDSELRSKKERIKIWVQGLRRKNSKCLVSSFCYKCCITGRQEAKTLIVFPDEILKKGIISINKPLEQVELLDIIKIYKRINCNRHE